MVKVVLHALTSTEHHNGPWKHCEKKFGATRESYSTKIVLKSNKSSYTWAN